jgi:transposase
MQVLYPRCAGLDVHKDQVVACMRWVEGREVRHEVRGFATSTRGLLELASWLEESDCTHVGLEATGVYWKPVWHVPTAAGLGERRPFTTCRAAA